MMAAVLAELRFQETGTILSPDDKDALARSLPGWPVFGEVREALAQARERGWKLVILSNTDRDLIESSMRVIDVPFDRAIVASEVGSYKPAHGHWRAFYESTGADKSHHVHVARSSSTTSFPPANSGSARSGSIAASRLPSPRQPGTV